jgi:hypothetical protein
MKEAPMRVLSVWLPLVVAGAAATHVYTGRLYDVFRVPSASVRCEVGKEGAALNMSCEHVPYARARYEVVFYEDNILVYRLGNPDKPVWSARGRP